MKILGIETSCDETSVAVVKDGVQILSNVIASQVEIHARYGGIVPEVASRQHMLAIIPTLKKALSDAGIIGLNDINAIAVANGPGLAGSLLVGVNLAKSLSLATGKPLIGVNHIEGHIYANWLENGDDKISPEFPSICLIVSGGHTALILMQNHGRYKQLGQTRDDAAGEAFDKVARLLGLGYPGGPVIEKAAEGIENTRRLPRAWLKGSDDFSFSGLKTATLHMARDLEITANNTNAPKNIIVAREIAAGFQESVTDVLVIKTVKAAEKHSVKQILLAGGVAANTELRRRITRSSPVPVLIPSPILCTDNGAMIASCGYFKMLEGKRSGNDLDVLPGMRLTCE